MTSENQVSTTRRAAPWPHSSRPLSLCAPTCPTPGWWDLIGWGIERKSGISSCKSTWRHWRASTQSLSSGAVIWMLRTRILICMGPPKLKRNRRDSHLKRKSRLVIFWLLLILLTLSDDCTLVLQSTATGILDLALVRKTKAGVWIISWFRAN